MKVVFLFPPGPTEKVLPPIPKDWDVHVIHSPEELTGEVTHGLDVLMVATHHHITREILHPLRGIKLIQRIGIGVDLIDLKAAREFGIRDQGSDCFILGVLVAWPLTRLFPSHCGRYRAQKYQSSNPHGSRAGLAPRAALEGGRRRSDR
jgi:hypothetical protein